jgi:hypothetical protein
MSINFMEVNQEGFDSELYIKILIAINKADKNNGTPEIDFVKSKAKALGINYDRLWRTTDKSFSIQKAKVSRLTAFVILKDCIMLASLDKNYTLDEKEKVFAYAEKLDIPRSDVVEIAKWLDDYQELMTRWDTLAYPEKY